jgi:hypothetical protein
MLSPTAWLDTISVAQHTEITQFISGQPLSFSKPLGVLFLKWLAQNKTKLVSKLKWKVMDHPE